MATVIDLSDRRKGRPKGSGPGGRFVTCRHCGEKHPIIRMIGGSDQCLTAFSDGRNWFCQHRGCRAAWLGDGGG